MHKISLLLIAFMVFYGTSSAKDKHAEITGQKSLTTTQGQPITIHLTDLIVNDPSHEYPSGYDLEVFDGKNYSVSGHTVTPDQSFTGTIRASVRIVRGNDRSKKYDLQIQVVPSHPHNVAPVITGQVQLSTSQNTPIQILLSHLTVSDPDNAYPNGFTLKILSGSNYTVARSQVIPVANFTGTLSVPVKVNDSKDDSAPFNLKISVIAVHHNVAPIITGQTALTTKKNKSLTLQLSDLSVNDPDNSYPTGFSLHILTGSNYSINGFQVTPARDFIGTLNVGVKVNDGENDSPVFNLKVVVNDEMRSNVQPVITEQVPLTINMNESLIIQFSHLTVVDPDNNYPNGFTITIHAGSNYSVSGAVVTPAKNFTGVLAVTVSVNDGLKESEPFSLKITVLPLPGNTNQEPVITGQVGLSTFKNQPITILLSHLIVNDPDSNYPADFKLTVLSGANYSVNGNTIAPISDFVGLLSIGVTVNDGMSSSEPYKLSVHVIDRSDLQIIGQKSLTTKEDSTLTLSLSDLIINDPAGKKAGTFSLQVLPGENFTTNNLAITPAANFNGNLIVSVSVSNGIQTSTPFDVLIVVTPVNDAPSISQLESEALIYSLGSDPSPVTYRAVVTDVDDDHLVVAEIGFELASYQQGNDKLLFNNTDNIRGVFDPADGILTFIGEATLAEYQNAIRSVQYSFDNIADTVQLNNSKGLYIRLNDGKTQSEIYTRAITIRNNGATVNIPNAFTPNDDNTNDTWIIEPVDEGAALRSTNIRVYNKNGKLVYEADSFDQPWDGRFKGDFLPSDSYFYTIEVELNYTRKNYKGIVTILR